MRALVILLLLGGASRAQLLPSPGPVVVNTPADCITDTAGHIISGTDAGPAIQATLNSIVGNGTIEIPGGSYCVRTGVLYVGGDWSIVSPQHARLYLQAPGQDIFHSISADRVSASGLKFFGDTAPNSAGNDKHVFYHDGDGIYTVEDVDGYGVYSEVDAGGGAFLFATGGRVDWTNSNCYGCADEYYSGVIAVTGGLRVHGARFQDYGNANGIYYDKESTYANAAWIVCGSLVMAGSLGAPGNESCVIDDVHFDEGANWPIWAINRPSVTVEHSTFLAPDFTNAGLQFSNVQHVTMRDVEIATRIDRCDVNGCPPEIWLVGPASVPGHPFDGTVELDDVRGRTITTSFVDMPGEPSHLVLWNQAYDVHHIDVRGGAWDPVKPFKVSPYTLVTVDAALPIATVQAQRPGTMALSAGPSPSPVWSDGVAWRSVR